MKRVICLYRVSSKQQVHDDDIPLQRTECKMFIEKHMDWEFKGEYIEKAISGYKKSIKDRDKLQCIMDDAINHRFDVLLTYMSDRLGRKEDETPVYVSRLNELGIEVWSVNEGQLKTEEHIDKLLNYIRFWQAEGESRKTGIRVRDAQIDRIKQGKHVGGAAPYGYDLVFNGEISSKGRALKKLVKNTDQSDIVKDIFNYYVYEGLGAVKIAKELNRRCIPAVKRVDWLATTVTSILKNPIYKGYFAYNRRQSRKRMSSENWIYSNEKIEELVIIDEITWDKAQKIRQARDTSMNKQPVDKDYQSMPKKTTGGLLFTGMIYCGYCGGKLTNGSGYNYWTTQDGVKHKKIVGRYKCTAKGNGSIECKAKYVYQQPQIEDTVIEEIHRYLGNLQYIDISTDIEEIQKERAEKERKEKAQLENKITEIKKSIEVLELEIPKILQGKSLFTVERITKLIHENEVHLEEAEKEYSSLESEMAKSSITKSNLEKLCRLILNWEKEFEYAETEKKKILLSQIIENVVVYQDKIELVFRIRIGDFLYGIDDRYDTSYRELIEGKGKVFKSSITVPFIAKRRYVRQS